MRINLGINMDVWEQGYTAGMLAGFVATEVGTFLGMCKVAYDFEMRRQEILENISVQKEVLSKKLTMYLDYCCLLNTGKAHWEDGVDPELIKMFRSELDGATDDLCSNIELMGIDTESKYTMLDAMDRYLDKLRGVNEDVSAALKFYMDYVVIA